MICCRTLLRRNLVNRWERFEMLKNFSVNQLHIPSNVAILEGRISQVKLNERRYCNQTI